MNGSTPWPPEWKRMEECPQYYYGMLHPYLNMRSQMLRDLGDYQPKPSNWDRIMEFLNQVIESRGYDYDNCPPELLNKNLPFIMPSRALLDSQPYSDYLTLKLNFVVKKINEEAEMHGEYYVYYGFVKVVEAGCHRSTFLTMTVADDRAVKTVQAMVFNEAPRIFQLTEWRFKPTN